MALSLSEISVLLEQKISNSYSKINIDEIGRVLSVGDGIARVYGLNKIQAGEMVEFASGVREMMSALLCKKKLDEESFYGR